MKMPHANEFLTNEEEAIASAAYAQSSALEAAAAFAYVVEKLDYSPAVRTDFDKAMKRCVNALASAIPNQYKQKVFDAMQEAQKEVDKVQQSQGDPEAFTVKTDAAPDVPVEAPGV